jgi:soluble lytic murein transglycosylase-like protein
MLNPVRILNIIICLTALSLGAPQIFGSQLYSYLDENGVRHFTNIAPGGEVRDLKVSGSPPPVQPGVEQKPSPPVSAREAKYDSIIDKYAGSYRLDTSLIRSMIAKESNFNARAVSPKGARGLMQLMPATAATVGVRNIHDPEENIRGGMKYMRKLMDKFDNNLVLSLAAYNAGENLVQRIGKVPNYRETKDYVRTITARYGKKEIAPKVEVARVIPMKFQYRDENGVLHLTNIPPVQRTDVSASWTQTQ